MKSPVGLLHGYWFSAPPSKRFVSPSYPPHPLLIRHGRKCALYCVRNDAPFSDFEPVIPVRHKHRKAFLVSDLPDYPLWFGMHNIGGKEGWTCLRFDRLRAISVERAKKRYEFPWLSRMFDHLSSEESDKLIELVSPDYIF